MANSDYYIQDNSDIEDKKLEAAKGLYQTGNFSAALKLYLDMINTSYSYKLYYEIGRCYYKLNNFVEAEKAFLQSISLEEYKNPSYIFLGNLYHKRQEVNKAIEYWALAFSFKPDDESVCLNLASAYFTKNMRFQSVFYYKKYLKYAKDKKSSYYLEIKKSIDGFEKIGTEFYQKAVRAVAMKDNLTAIKALEYAAKTYPLGLDINLLLAKLYFEEKEFLKSVVYFKQAYCIDNKSLDVLQRLSSALINAGDFTTAYCCLKRMLPLVTNNQKEYLDIIKTIKQLEDSFDGLSFEGHNDWADKYWEDNNYMFSLFEYENCVIIDGTLAARLSERIQRLKSFINPEERIIKSCFERGGASYSNGDYVKSNKYFTKIMTLSGVDSSEYKFAKSRIVNV